MGKYKESDISYVRGRIEGYLLSIALHSCEDTQFDEERWKEHYGSRVVYNSIPVYPSEEAVREDRNELVLVDWEEATETKYLKEGAELPDDRSGTIVLDGGTAVILRSKDELMFSLSDTDVAFIGSWDSTLLEIIRDAYGFYERK